MPGKGKKFIFKAKINDSDVNVIIDTGSTTTLIRKSLVVDLRLKHYTSRLPINFLGMFGSKLVPDATIASLALQIGSRSLVMPAYVMDALPYGTDLLIGTDQLGTSLGISIDLFNIFSIFFYDSENRIQSFKLGAEKELSPTRDIKSSSRLSLDTESSSIKDSVYKVDASEVKIPEDELDSVDLQNHDLDFIPKEDRLVFVNQDPKKENYTLMSIKLEIENISSALGVLKDELNKLPSQMDVIPDGKFSRSRNAEVNSFNSKLTVLQREFELVINALSRELKRLKRAFHSKKQRLARGVKRNEGKRERKIITEKIKCVDRLDITPDITNNFSFLHSDTPRGHISSIDLVELIIDSGLYSEHMNPDAVMHVIENKLVLYLADSLPNDYREEIVNIVQLASKKIDDLGSDTADWMNEIKRRDILVYHRLLAEETEALNEVLQRYSSSVLIGPGDDFVMGRATARGKPIKYKIELIPGGLEILQKKKKKAYPNARPLRDLMKSTTEEMQKSGVGFLNPLTFSAYFASPVFFVKNKSKFRLVCDYKDLNSVTTDDIYPLPHMDYIFQNLGDSRGKMNTPSYFSILDLKSGYWQVPLEETAQKLAAILLPFGIFQFICLPFGLKNAPAFFQRYMDEVLKEGLGNYVFVYIDDIVIFSDTFSNHIKHLDLVLSFLKESNLKANVEKCHFCLSQLKVLGKIVSAQGISTDPDLIRAMVEYPSPGNDTGNVAKKKLKRFLAMLSYYRAHVPDFGPHTALLSDLLKEDYLWNAYSWTLDHESSFKFLKQKMIEAPILAFPDLSRDFYLQSDASKVGAGAVLFQLNDLNRRCVVSYASWLFSNTQRRYNTTERELLGLILAVRKWKPFFYHTKFYAETDHEPLVGYLKLSDPYGKISRWAAELAQFSFQIKYIKGETNIPSDALSRVYEEVDILESIYILIKSDKIDRYNRASKILSKAFSVEEVEAYTCVESDEYDDCIFINSLCYSMPTDAEWSEAQAADDYFAPYYNWIKFGTLPTVDDEAKVIVSNSKFFRLDSSSILVYSSEGGVGPWRRCVPKKFRKLILSECHDSLWSGGHLGRDKTKEKLREKYYFRRMDQFTDLWIKTCPICLSTKRKHPTKLVIPLGSISASRIWELVSIDLWDVGVLSGRGHKYVLTVIDVFSKFAFAIPIKNKKATTIASKLHKHVFSIFGAPERLHSDNGKEFCNEILDAMCRVIGVDRSRTTAYHPQGNAVAERIHQFFQNALAAFVGRDQRDWDLFLPSLIHVYLDTVHSSLGGFAPSQIMFGRKLGLPLVESHDEAAIKPQTRVVDFAVKLQLALDRAYKIVLEVVKQKEFENIQPSIGKKTLSYNVGEKVGLQVESLPAGVKSKKLFPRFSGPFTVVKAAHDGRVLYLADVHGKIRKVPVSVKNVKPWPDRQTLLEQFERYEILNRKFSPSKVSERSPPVISETIASPEQPVAYEEEPEDLPLDMDVEDISKPSQPVEPTFEPIDLDYERYFEDDDDFDIMGNPINKDIYLLKAEAVKKFKSLTQGMYFIDDIPVLKHRHLEYPTKVHSICIEQDIYSVHYDYLIEKSYKCTNISIS
ncbi:MAG: reverse transcriptase domain-containing protein [Bdellovibrio sp.]